MKKVKAWIQAARLRTLPLAFSTILMGSFLAADGGRFDGGILFFCLLTTLFLQILSNLANDFGDSESGVDSDSRVGPARTVQSGLISRSEMKKGLIAFSLLSLASGLYLIYLSFGDDWVYALIFFILGITAIAAAIKYTVGNNPYGYMGLGDLFVLIFFGLVGVGATYFLYTRQFEIKFLLPALCMGLLSTAVLNVNNIRDIQSDRVSGKNSIPVRVGKKNATYYHWFLLLTAMGSMLIFTAIGNFDWNGYVYVISYPLFIRNGIAVQNKKSEELDPFLRQLALSILLFVLLFGAGILF